jgi:hypothetical protein
MDLAQERIQPISSVASLLVASEKPPLLYAWHDDDKQERVLSVYIQEANENTCIRDYDR